MIYTYKHVRPVRSWTLWQQCSRLRSEYRESRNGLLPATPNVFFCFHFSFHLHPLRVAVVLDKKKNNHSFPFVRRIPPKPTGVTAQGPEQPELRGDRAGPSSSITLRLEYCLQGNRRVEGREGERTHRVREITLGTLERGRGRALYTVSLGWGKRFQSEKGGKAIRRKQEGEGT